MAEKGSEVSELDYYEQFVNEYTQNVKEINNPGNVVNSIMPQDDPGSLAKVKEKPPDNKKSCGSQVIMCNVCDKYFKSANCLIKHSVAHTNERPYVCTMCPKTFKHSSTLKNHTKKHNGQLNHVCEVCNKRFLKPSILKEHFRVHSGEKPYQCSLCSKAFAVQQYLTRHMTTHTGEKRYQCSFCPKKFTDNSSLRYHKRTHTGERPFSCSECGETFISKLTVDRHYQCKHSNNKPFCCHICNKRFKFKVYLKKHLLVHAGERNFKCSICSRSFFTRANLKRHVLVHSAVKPYNCCLCDKDFRCWRSMIRHLSTHGKMHMWKCSNCDRKFHFSKHLRKHYEVFCPKGDIYAKKKNYKKRSLKFGGGVSKVRPNLLKSGRCNCKICGEQFTKLNILYGKHMKIHRASSTQEYKCQFCLRKCSSKKVLVKHQTTHYDEGGLRHRLMVGKLQKQLHVVTNCSENESPLYCRKCHLYFRRRRSFNYHMLMHTEQIFYCLFCNRKYMKYQILFEHMKRNHDKHRQHAKAEMLSMENSKKTSSDKKARSGNVRHQSRADTKPLVAGHLLNYPQRTRRSRKTLNYVVEKLKMSTSSKRQKI